MTPPRSELTKGLNSMFDTLASNNDTIAFILQWSVAIIIAFFASKLIINIAIGAASRNLNGEVERIAEMRAQHAKTKKQFETLATERAKDIKAMEMQQNANT